jgi:competence protein ComEA
MSPRDLWQVYRVPLLLGIGSVLCIIFSITLFIKSYQSESPITFSSAGISEASVAGIGVQKTITVDIEGAVVNPGVYDAPQNSRIEDLIGIAGGLSSAADVEKIASSINRAAKVVDGAKIVIPKKGETGQIGNLSTLGTQGTLINVNSANENQLDSLPGIGAVTAAKIINGRPYQTLDELVSRKILFQSTFDKIKDQITL